MEKVVIDGTLYKNMVIFGAQNLYAKVEEVNNLNVFPIPDGDTGENMYLTIKGGVDCVRDCDEKSISKMAKRVSDGMLLNARGNSGVILSQLFFGLAEGLDGLDEASVVQFEKAMENGVKRAYGAVAVPVEGTILTVARETVEGAVKFVDKSLGLDDFLLDVLKVMKTSLEHTPELLSTLKEAGVIDSGGAGLLYITEGFYNALFEKASLGELAVTSTNDKGVDFSAFNENSKMEFGYCTELLLQLLSSKTDVEKFSVEDLIEFLNGIGDSIVAFKTGSVVKLHVHTFTPWEVLRYCQNYGEFLTVKIENMTIQHSEKVKSDIKIQTKVKRTRRKYALVTVASGKGLADVFTELGADYVVNGGQTNNPSAEDFLTAFEEVNADYVFVLPNNKNIILTAKQAGEMYQDSTVKVIESKNIGQGYSALSMLDYSSDDADTIEKQLVSDMEGVVTGMVTTAVRDSSLGGVSVKKGEFVGLTDKTILCSSVDKLECAKALCEKLLDSSTQFFITSFGAGVTEQEKIDFSNFVKGKYSQIEFYEIDGGQEVYDYIFIIE